jgi:preprotein translocase subunit SecY
MLASNHGTLMELGISPIVISSLILKVITSTNLVNLVPCNYQENEFYKILEKHQILMKKLPEDVIINNTSYSTNNSILIPKNQNKTRLIKAPNLLSSLPHIILSHHLS